jgi:YesN/AraC family two-component response regulator
MIDLRMPDIDGLALLTKIREDSELKKLKVVVISSEQDRDRLRELAKLNISGYLLKPFDAAKVRACLNQTAQVVEPTEAPVAEKAAGQAATSAVPSEG